MQKIFGLILLSFALASCARIGSPTGGTKDETPPRFLSAKPDTLATHVSSDIKQIFIYFDEYILIRDAAKQILISPPTEVPPQIQPSARAMKYISIKFFQPLEENTTYTINFGSSIQDNNEGNKLTGFSYTFSTGDFIDSLKVTGTVKNSLKTEPPVNAVVALYKIFKDSLEKDSVNLKKKPYYVTRTDSSGAFTLNHLHDGDFKLIVFNDLNNNLTIEPDKEEIGFLTALVNPKDNPSAENIVLSPAKLPYRALGGEQDGQGVIKFKFKGNPKNLIIRALEPDFPPTNISHEPFADSLYIYFNNKDLKNIDKRKRLKFLAEYQQKVDTVNALYDNTIETELTLSPVEKEVTPTEDFSLKSNNFISELNKDLFSVTNLKTKTPVAFTLQLDTISERQFDVKFAKNFDTQYRIEAKSEAVKDFLGNLNKDSLSYDITIRKQSEYGNFYLKLQNKPTSKFFVQLLNEKYKVLKNIYTDADNFEFKNLRPASYLIRILVDENNNGFWDAADLEHFIPAERTYIYAKPIDIKAFWDMNETWILD
ncbi:MAG: Ig-like domain-containing protein [Flavobacteriaceae bacterium]|jgi:uncharacterized protein (DUF2141 family)|nr:Ig-like domain-containing protein [Flavobacteriaceae bacterium]